MTMFLDSDNPPRPAARAIRRSRPMKATPTASIARTSTSSTAACRTTWACAACWMRWRSSKRCTKRACRRRSSSAKQDHRLHRQFAVLAAHQLGPVRGAAGHRRHPAQGGRHADRRVFLRSGRTAERHGGALADPCAGSATPARWPASKDPVSRRSATRPAAEIYAIDVSFPKLKDKAELRLPEPAAHFVRAACRGGRSPARRGRHDHHGIRPNSSGC